MVSIALYLRVHRGVEAGARGRGGREALLWSEPVEWDAASDFTAGSRELRMLVGLSVEYAPLNMALDRT